MKTKLIGSIAAGAATAILVVCGAGSANAAILYENTGYSGSTYTGTYARNIGGMSDRTSSIRGLNQNQTYWEDQDFLGYHFTSAEDCVSLAGYRTDGMGWNIDWNDRITSLQ